MGPRRSNRIEQIENLDCLHNITFISLSNNKIKAIENLTQLRKLIFLDISDNYISEVNTKELPQSIVILNLLNNPCTSYPCYRQTLVKEMVRLKQLDLKDVTNDEKRDVGLEVSSDEDEEEEEEESHRTGNVGGGNGHGIQESFQTMATTMMLRSQRRAEDALQTHKNRSSELDDLRVQLKIPPSARKSQQSSVNF